MKNEIKVNVVDLEIGMFVSRLDRPWIGTSFLLEGFLIASQDDIEQVQNYCKFVYVDIEQSKIPNSHNLLLKPELKTRMYAQTSQPISKQQAEIEQKEYQALRKTTYTVSTSFQSEVSTATKSSHKLSHKYEKLVADLLKGRNFDLETFKEGVSVMVESIIRNPSAMMWIAQMRDKDQYTYSRALGTSVWSATFGRHLGLEIRSINQLALGGLLLDVGKNKLPPYLFRIRGTLSKFEQKAMRDHVDFSLRILAKHEGEELENSHIDQEILQMVATHHERHDGSGYPHGLKGSEIPIFGRIAGIVDTYDAITSERPYDSPISRTSHAAISELYSLRGTKFQTELVEQFIQTVGIYPTGTLVELNTGQVGAVSEINNLRRLQPKIILLLDENKKFYPDFEFLDLANVKGGIRVAKSLEPGSYGINMQELFL